MNACDLEEARLGQPPCKNGGLCASHEGDTRVACICEDGWKGERCEVPRDGKFYNGVSVDDEKHTKL